MLSNIESAKKLRSPEFLCHTKIPPSLPEPTNAVQESHQGGCHSAKSGIRIRAARDTARAQLRLSPGGAHSHGADAPVGPRPPEARHLRRWLFAAPRVRRHAARGPGPGVRATWHDPGQVSLKTWASGLLLYNLLPASSHCGVRPLPLPVLDAYQARCSSRRIAHC